MVRQRDAEAELNLPPGFRFHPTDEELVVHYLSKRAAKQRLPVPIIAEVDLYKFDPWQLPEKALFGQREWYFFTPRDRKYPNGSRPNRAAGTGYWKATGADKPVIPKGSNKPVAIKKALVFYSGKAPNGVKTDWIMHEYRMADANRGAGKKGSIRLDDCVLCRLYNKKNNWAMMQQQEVTSFGDAMDPAGDPGSDNFRTPESDIDNEVMQLEFGGLNQHGGCVPSQASSSAFALGNSNMVGPHITEQHQVKEDNEWFTGLNLDDLQSTFLTFRSAPILEATNQEQYLQSLLTATPRSNQNSIPPTF